MNLLKRIGLALFLAFMAVTAFSAQDPSALLEKAIYAEETLGNLKEAIGIYQQIVALSEANRATAAQALFRLGMCYQKSGRSADAQSTFARLAKLYPEQKDLISRIPSPPSQAPSLGNASWVDGEVLQYSGTLKGGGPGFAIKVTHVYESTSEDGKAGWMFRSLYGASAIEEVGILRMDSKYAPIDFRQKMQDMGNNIKFTPDHAEITSNLGNASGTKSIPLTRTTFLEEELYLLLRCLPLQVGFKTALPLLNVGKGSIYDMQITVVGREEVTVPAGTFDCFKIVLGKPDSEETCYFSGDAHKYPVKIKFSDKLDMELSSISRAEKNRPAQFDDGELGVRLSAPPRWIFSTSAMLTTNMVSIFDPDAESESYLLLSKPPTNTNAGVPLVEQIANQLTSMYQTQYKDYQVRHGSRENVTINGNAGLRLIADHKALLSGRESVQYMYFLETANKLGYLMFQTSRDNFEKKRPIFDSIANSLQFQ